MFGDERALLEDDMEGEERSELWQSSLQYARLGENECQEWRGQWADEEYPSSLSCFEQTRHISSNMVRSCVNWTLGTMGKTVLGEMETSKKARPGLYKSRQGQVATFAQI